ncbi:ABC transporter permease [Pseudonocardia sp. CA-107938]|uniref:ABC transporter permease n=1 Tax=Pseudonocardia sp. CA-107938 TaxID=3240021 RepID=UPI003D8E5317
MTAPVKAEVQVPVTARAAQLLARWETLLAVLLLALIILAATTAPGFLGDFNVSTSLAQISEKALFALPLALLLICREIDISVASTAALSGITLGMALQAGLPVAVAVVVAVGTGLLCGALNGVLVTVLKLPSLVVTLGTLALFRGLCYVAVGGQPISDIAPGLIALGNDDVPGLVLPLALLPFLVLAPIFTVVLQRTPTGRQLYAIGGSPETAHYAGVRSRRLVLALFVVTGGVAAIAGVILTGRTAQASPDSGLGFELDALTMVFLGGISVLGGKGRLTSVLLAVALIATLRSYLQLLGVSGYAQSTAIGLVLILSLLGTNLAEQIQARVSGQRRRRRLLHEPADGLACLQAGPHVPTPDR